MQAKPAAHNRSSVCTIIKMPFTFFCLHKAVVMVQNNTPRRSFTARDDGGGVALPLSVSLITLHRKTLMDVEREE